MLKNLNNIFKSDALQKAVERKLNTVVDEKKESVERSFESIKGHVDEKVEQVQSLDVEKLVRERLDSLESELIERLTKEFETKTAFLDEFGGLEQFRAILGKSINLDLFFDFVLRILKQGIGQKGLGEVAKAFWRAWKRAS